MNAVDEMAREEFFQVFEADILPGNMSDGEYRALKRAGVKFRGTRNRFYIHAKLPDSWEKRTEGPYYVYIFDANGIERGSYFLKAQIHDRSASTTVNRRYTTWCGRTDNYNWCAWDSATNTVLFEGGSESDEAYRGAKAWLDEHLPQWKDPGAYWPDTAKRWWEFWKK